jgi:hypothetical protein
MDHVRIEKMNASEPLMKCRDNVPPIPTAGLLLPEDLSVAITCLLARGGRHKGGMNSIQA